MLRRLQKASAVRTSWKNSYSPLKVRVKNSSFETRIAGGKILPLTTGLNRDQCVALIASGLCYGGLHALAFGIPLRSTAETLLWDISCLTVASLGVIYLFFAYWFDLVSSDCLENLLIALAYLIVLLYTTARVFLVVEVFLSLPYVDQAVYQVPRWSIYFPHIG